MEFTNLVDMITVFANEYCNTGSLVLVVGDADPLRNIFTFINSEVVSIDTSPGHGVDIVVGTILPFENYSFDLIIELKNTYLNFDKFLKPNGKFLKKNVVNALENYKLNGEIFSVV